MAGQSQHVRYIHGTNEYGGESEAKVSASGHIATIEYAHRAVHEDGFAMASYYDSDVDTSAPLKIHIKTTTDWEIHSHFDVSASAGAVIRLYETETTAVVTTGNAMTLCRMNRGSTVSGRVFSYYDAVESSAGTLLFTQHNGGTTAPTPSASPIGGGARNGEEFIFPANTSKSYILSITPDADNTKIGVVHEYYEVTPN